MAKQIPDFLNLLAFWKKPWQCKVMAQLLQNAPDCCPLDHNLNEDQRRILLAVIAIGQTHILEYPHELLDHEERLKTLLDQLIDIDQFYAPIGGLVGYQKKVEELLGSSPTPCDYKPPVPCDIKEQNEEVRKALLHAIKHWGDFAEIYPVGGAADRLKLQDDISHVDLPAARLQFAGQPLLAGLMRDLAAREYLHYKLFGKRVATPVVMMTSQEKNNATHIREICADNDWFGRGEEHFQFITQPLVPTFNKLGKWQLNEPLKLKLKPGGHGAIWNLMLKEKTFDWLRKHGCTKAFIRQINNPIASIDYGALAFLGFGHKEEKAFGFASCDRLEGANEGLNVIATDKEGNHCLTNVEYCALKAHKIENTEAFPANTNILFADIEQAERAAQKQPFPGMLLNFRSGLARLEAMMQNLADSFTAANGESLPTYLTLNYRHKTISTTKRKFQSGGSWLETPEGCFFDLTRNSHELLTTCNFLLPSLNSDAFFDQGPPFIFLYHPILGPLYSIIAQKLRGGKLALHSELILEIADICVENLDLDGSLIVTTDHPSSDLSGRCTLKNVTIKNAGYEQSEQPFWRHAPKRQESLHIHLGEGSEFIAKNVTLTGHHHIVVPAGMCMTANTDGSMEAKPAERDRPFWTYTMTPDHRILLS